jgi:hypothetical protein
MLNLITKMSQAATHAAVAVRPAKKHLQTAVNACPETG